MTDLFGRFATTRQIEPIIGIKERTLYRLRQANILKKGKHYRLKNPLNPKSHILYDVDAVIDELTLLEDYIFISSSFVNLSINFFYPRPPICDRVYCP